MAITAVAWVLMASHAVPAAEEQKPAVAVLDFKAGNTAAGDAVALSGFVRRALVKTGVFKVTAEDQMRQKLLSEAAFQQSGCTDSTCAVKLGRFLNVRKIIVGEYTVLEGMRFLSAMIVDVESGQIERSAEVKGFQIGNADEAARQVAAELTGTIAPAASASMTPVAPALSGKVSASTAVSGIKLQEITGRDGAPMVLIPAGDFNMGSDVISNEQPIHFIRLDAYYIDKYEVTFRQYDAFCDATGRTKPSDNSWGRGDRPVINVTWDDAKEYCEWAGKRLPTEAEWEQTCRAGTEDKPYCFGDDVGLLSSYAWYSGNSGGKAHRVGEKTPNAFGIHDMHGNVWEWCADWYHAESYAVISQNNPQGPSLGRSRILRGGSWGDEGDKLRSTYRFNANPRSGNARIGCRCAVAFSALNSTTTSTLGQKINVISSPPASGTVLQEITGRDGASMVLIPAGDFNMGSDVISNEQPIHLVHLDAYYIDKYEVTFRQYDAFCDATGRTKPSDNSWGRGDRPVINVTWSDAKEYCEWAGKRLPTEAEWERACRAGTNTAYFFGNDTGLLGTYAWFSGGIGKTGYGAPIRVLGKFDNKTHPVGEKSPNVFGLYDMHGNVWEWCADWYDEGDYAISPRDNPGGRTLGKYRVLRGGSWDDNGDDLRSAFRSKEIPENRNTRIGFRCAKTP